MTPLQQLRLDMSKYSGEAIARASGVHAHTVRAIQCGRQENPQLQTLEKIRKGLDKLEEEGAK